MQDIIDQKLGAKLERATYVITLLVWALVLLMRSPYKIPLPDGISFGFLPAVHAGLNGAVAVCLIAALVAIKGGRVAIHRNLISVAMILSGIFLLGYVTYHFTTPATPYGGEGVLRYVYFTLLITHILAAALSFPFILLSWTYGFTGQTAKHRRMVRYVFPAWLYVALTGPACFLMLLPYYP